MLQFDAIISSIHGLSDEEKLKLRVVLNEQLKGSNAPARDGAKNDCTNRAKRIIGLFADEPDLIDQVLEAVYERRSRPWRLESST